MEPSDTGVFFSRVNEVYPNVKIDSEILERWTNEFEKEPPAKMMKALKLYIEDGNERIPTIPAIHKYLKSLGRGMHYWPLKSLQELGAVARKMYPDRKIILTGAIPDGRRTYIITKC